MAAGATSAPTRKRIKVNVPKDRLTASILILKPIAGEFAPSLDDINAELTQSEVVYGIDSEAISRLIAARTWDISVPIAQGVAPVRGTDATIEFCFETSHQHHPVEDADGRIDYRNMGFIQNVHEGDALAKKTPPSEGTPGTGVDGKEIAPIRGRDIQFKVGEKTKVSDDGLSLLAAASGAIVYRAGIVSISDVVNIDSDIDFNTGNIDTTGSVRISGDVKAGFIVKGGGNVEIGGNVEDAKIYSEGNVLVKGGFFGNGDGLIQAGNDITIKFAENQKLEAGNEIIVGGELVNCKAMAKNRVIIKGQKGKILGGEVYAGKEIRVPVAGSDAGTITTLTVAFDNELMKELQHVNAELSRLDSDSKRVKESIYNLYKLQLSGKLPENKVLALKQLQEFQKSVPEEMAEQEKRKSDILAKLAEFRDSKIIIENRLYPGVIARFGIVTREFSDELIGVKLLLDGHQVSVSDFKRDRV